MTSGPRFPAGSTHSGQEQRTHIQYGVFCLFPTSSPTHSMLPSTCQDDSVNRHACNVPEVCFWWQFQAFIEAQHKTRGVSWGTLKMIIIMMIIVCYRLLTYQLKVVKQELAGRVGPVLARKDSTRRHKVHGVDRRGASGRPWWAPRSLLMPLGSSRVRRWRHTP